MREVIPIYPWIGVDPGSRDTGIVAREGQRLVWWTIVHRTESEDMVPGRGVEVGAGYIHAVNAAIREAYERLPSARLAVEGVVAPKGFKHGQRNPIQPGTIAALSIVIGGVLAVWADAVVVPPGGHGTALLCTYPDELVTDGERRLGIRRPARHGASVNHVRSAWDVVTSATTLCRFS